MDERLRQLQREAFSGGPDAIWRYRQAVNRVQAYGKDYRLDASQPPSRQKIIDLLIFYGVRYIIIDSKKRGCNWNGKILVLGPCPLRVMFNFVSQAIYGSETTAFIRMATREYEIEIAVFYLVVEQYYSGKLRTPTSLSWFEGEIGLEANIQLLNVMEEMEKGGQFVGPLDGPYHKVRKKFLKFMTANLDEGIGEAIRVQDQWLEEYPRSKRHQAKKLFWETLNQYELTIEDVFELYEGFSDINESSSPAKVLRSVRDLLKEHFE